MDARVVVLALTVVTLPVAADVRVQQEGGLLNVEASGAPVSEVLDRLARQTGMQVVYEGAPPRLPVTLSIARRTPAEAVFSLLEGLGLNYALRLDESGGRVLTLVMAGAAASTPAGAAPVPQRPELAKMPPPYPPPPSYPQEPSEDEYFDPQAGIIPPPPPQPPQEFTITPQQPEPQPQPEQQPAFSAPSLGSGFSSPFSSGGFSAPPIIGNTPPAPNNSPPPSPFPGEPPPDEKEP